MLSAGHRQVRDQKSRRHVSDLIDLFQHVEIDLADLQHVGDFLFENRF